MRKRECWCYRHHQQQFQCSSVRVNERALQTEGPSQRAKDDEPGTFLLTWNIPCIMTATSCEVSAAYDGRCVTSLSVLSSRSNVFKKHVSTFLGQMWRVLFSFNRCNIQLLIMQVKIFKTKNFWNKMIQSGFGESLEFSSHFFSCLLKLQFINKSKKMIQSGLRPLCINWLKNFFSPKANFGSKVFERTTLYQ